MEFASDQLYPSMKTRNNHLHHCPESTPSEERTMNNIESISNESQSFVSWTWANPSEVLPTAKSATLAQNRFRFVLSRVDVLKPLRAWLDGIQFTQPQFAHRICQLVPAQCPFERTVTLFGHTLFHIPPLCKLNPLYEEVVGLRFRALCYLADECGEDISRYC